MPDGIRRCNMGIGYCAQEGLQQTMDSEPLDARKPADLQTKKSRGLRRGTKSNSCLTQGPKGYSASFLSR